MDRVETKTKPKELDWRFLSLAESGGFRRRFWEEEALLLAESGFPAAGGGRVWAVCGEGKMVRRRLFLVLLCVTVLAPIVLFTDRLATTPNSIGESLTQRKIDNERILMSVFLDICLIFQEIFAFWSFSRFFTKADLSHVVIVLFFCCLLQ